MSTEQSIQDRILVNKSIYTESTHEISIRNKTKTTKGKKYKTSCKKGRICGSKHPSICAETKKKATQGLLLSYKRRDPFFMVDGIVVEEQEIDSVNTNSGVLFEDDLKYLQ